MDAIRNHRNIEQDVKTALQQSGYPAVRHIEYQLDGEELTLIGKVPTFYMKQVANTTVAKIEGVAVVYNLLEVA